MSEKFWWLPFPLLFLFLSLSFVCFFIYFLVSLSCLISYIKNPFKVCSTSSEIRFCVESSWGFCCWDLYVDGWSSDRFTDTQWRWTDPDLVLFPDRQTRTVTTDQRMIILFSNWWLFSSIWWLLLSSGDLLLSGTDEEKMIKKDILVFIFGIFLSVLVCSDITKHNYSFPNNIRIFKSPLFCDLFLKI